MADGNDARGPLWVDGQFTARVRGLGSAPARIARIRRPFALIGSIPGADIRIDDPAVAPRHALLLLDRRGVFGVDLLSATGTRFAGAEAASAWLGAGDILEVAGRRIEILRLLIDGRPIDPPLCGDDPLSTDAGLPAITLEPLDVPGPPWMLGSALAFVGRGDACAIRVEDASASETHCAIWRSEESAYLIDLLGRRTLLGGRPVEGASALLDGDVLDIGEARFGIKIEPAAGRRNGLALRESAPPPEALLARLIDAAGQGLGSRQDEILDAIQDLRADTAAMLGAQIERIEALNREIAALRDEVRGHREPSPPPAAPLRLDFRNPPPKPESTDSAAWILDRLKGLEVESRSTWRDLLGRLTSSAQPRSPAESARSTLPARLGPPDEAVR